MSSSHFFFFFLLPCFFFFCFFFLGSLDRWIAESQVKIFSGDEGLEDVEASSHRSWILRGFVTRKDRALKYGVWVRQLGREKTVTIFQFERICILCKQARESQPEIVAASHCTTTVYWWCDTIKSCGSSGVSMSGPSRGGARQHIALGMPANAQSIAVKSREKMEDGKSSSQLRDWNERWENKVGDQERIWWDRYFVSLTGTSRGRGGGRAAGNEGTQRGKRKRLSSAPTVWV